MLDFSLYAEIAKWIGWPAVSGILLLLIAATIFFYTQQIKILKEKNIQQQEEIETAKIYNPDQLMNRLMERHKLAMEELQILIAEKKSVENELLLTRKEIENMMNDKNLNEQTLKAKYEKLVLLVSHLTTDYDDVNKMLMNKQIEIDTFYNQANEVIQKYRNRFGPLSDV